MMRKGLSVLIAVAVLPMLTNATRADVRREHSERRPYIVEVGEPYSIGTAVVDRESNTIDQLRDYLVAYGYPEYAEIQEIEPQWPWASYEVRLYYLRRNLEVVFGHVFVSEAAEDLGMMKFLDDITPEKRHQIDVILAARSAPPVVAPPPPPPPPPAPVMESAPAPPPPAPPAPPPSGAGLKESLVERIEAAADRAAVAADKAAEQSEAAVRAADRTTSIVEKMEQTAPSSKQ